MVSPTNHNFILPSLGRDCQIRDTKTRNADQNEDVLIDEFLTKAVSATATTALVLGASILAYHSYNYGISSVFNNISSFFTPQIPPQNSPQIEPNLPEKSSISPLTKLGIFEVATFALIKSLKLNPQDSYSIKTLFKTNLLYTGLTTVNFFMNND